MKKRISPNLVEQAIIAVPKFKAVHAILEQQVTLRGQSKSTLNNYIRRIALFVLHFNQLPEHVSDDEINEYLAAAARDPKSPSRSSFKHMVYGLRYYFRILGMNKQAIALPSLKGDTKLPVILNRKEFKELFSAPLLLKQRIVPLSPTFDAVWQTLRSFGYTHYGVESGAIAVLHSWGQNLCLHPHIHCIVPAAGYAINGTWKNIGTEQLYLYPVNQLSDTFKGKFLDKLKRTLRKNSALHMFNQAIQ